MTPRKLSEIRAWIPAALRRRSPRRWILPLATDTLAFVLGWLLAVLAPFPWGIPGAVLCGMAISALFVLGHDALHGTFSDNPRFNTWLGQWLLFPSLTPEVLWKIGHNRVHHGLTGLDADWIWRPLSPEAYAQLPKGQAMLYRIYRHPFGFWLYYLVEVWWKGIVLFRGLEPEVRASKGKVAGFLLVWCALSAALGGVSGILLGVVLPFLIFEQVIAFVVFLNHTHPKTGFAAERKDWNPAEAQLENSVSYTSRFFRLWLHGILVHTPHHVDTSIPFFALSEALDVLDSAFPGVLHIETGSPVIAAFLISRQCFCYDYAQHRWESFDAMHSSASRYA